MKNTIPTYVEKGFRWMKETISLIYSHHQHPLPMVALIFMYIETLGKPLVKVRKNKKGEEIKRETNEKVTAFVKEYMPDLWKALENFSDRESILSNHYRNGLAHQMFMKNNCGIHEDKSGDFNYVSTDFPNCPYSINIDCLTPEFLNAISSYRNKLITDAEFLKKFETELPRKV